MKIANLINKGCDLNSEIYVDTEAREYDAHLIPVREIVSDDRLCDDKEHIIIIIN